MTRRSSILLAAATAGLAVSGDEREAEERLSFQTSGPWSPHTNLNADVATVYGIGLRRVEILSFAVCEREMVNNPLELWHFQDRREQLSQTVPLSL
jgi:hypothetical protein